MDISNQQINGIPSVMDMVKEYSQESGTPVNDIFKRDKPTATIVSSPVPTASEKSEQSESNVATGNKPKNESGVWQPKGELLEDMPELNSETTGAVYSRDEFKPDPKGPVELVNITDDIVSQEALESMDELRRANFNISRSKQRLGIEHMNIPTLYTSQVMDCASDDNVARAAAALDELIGEIVRLFPDAVISWLPGHEPISTVNQIPPSVTPEQEPVITETVVPEAVPASTNVITEEAVNVDSTVPEKRREPTPIIADATAPIAPELQIVIDKSKAPEVLFNNEDLEKIRKARSIELNIVEDRQLHYNVIDDPENDIDVILSKYTRKFNDKTVSLPASRYRCTLTGLSYPEIMDLSYTQELNKLDNERKKWSIAYDHIRNASIGPFADFDDFLQKTSYIDLDFILWGILCATCMGSEIVSIECHSTGCGNVYDWLYSPTELLEMDKMSAQTLEEMRITGEANTTEEIEENYNNSMLRLGNVIELPNSKFVIGFGHISAFTYLNEVYGKLENLNNDENPMISTAAELMSLTVIKYVLLPDGNGSYRKKTAQNDILKIIHILDEVDFQTIDEIVSLMIKPYQLTFSIKDIVCPKCKTRSSVPIENMVQLLFIMSRSLSNVNVVLKKQ